MFLETLGMDEGVAGGCAFAFSAVAVVLRPFIGWLLNNGRRKSILIIGITGMFLMPLGYMTSGIMAGMGYAAVSAVVLAIVCRMLQGAALAFSNTTTATIASDALPQSRFAEGMGYFGMATALATSIAPALSLKLMSVNFSIMFIVSSAFMVVAFLLLAVAPCRTTFYIAAILAGYAFGGIEPALQSMAVHIAPPERRGSANSTFLCAYDIGLGGGGGIAGVLISRLGYSKMFLIVAMATVASILLYFFWGSRHPSSLKYKRG